MAAEAKTTKEYVARLRSGEWRKRSVLVFRGTGLNAWHYYSFLKNFSLSELSEFAAIYGVSGGAAIVWFYVLAQCSLFDDAAGRNFDRIIRSTMNAPGLRARLRRIVRRQLPYNEEDIGRFLSSLPASGPSSIRPMLKRCVISTRRFASCRTWIARRSARNRSCRCNSRAA